MGRLTTPALLTLIGLFITGSVQSATAQPQIPENAAGDEVFGEGYLPYAPPADAVPLEPGRPAAGFQLDTQDSPEVRDALSARYGEPTPTSVEKTYLRKIPLRRSFRRSNALPTFTARRVTAAPAATPITPAALSATLTVHFVNVGQGAGAILEFPCHTAVIDTGGEYATGPHTVEGGKVFDAYLDRFFHDRPERNRTIDVVFTSHPHEDHLAGTRAIMSRTGADAYVVRNVVDNGQTHDKGSLKAQRDFVAWAKARGANYSAITVDATRSATGVTNGVIDPVGACNGVDPIITGFWGANYAKIRPNAPPSDAWLNPNNHSLVLRIDFGQSSFLFVGDLEDTGSNEMLREFGANPGIFDVDVYAVSHHGAGDDTTDALIKAMKPKLAMISMGSPAAHERSTAWSYGHPRLKAIDVMQKQPEIVSGTRQTKNFQIASAVNTFAIKPISRAIYGTGWEDTLVVEATADGKYRIVSGQQ